MFRLPYPISIAGCVLAFWACQFARADTIVMPGGATFDPEGSLKEVIYSETGQKPPSSAGPAQKPDESKKVPEVTLYMEIPVVGVFGEDILPEGLKTCLRWCSQNPNIKHIVFRIKSPGGLVAAAEEIQEVMERYDNRFEYHAVVEQGISASIWVVFACDTIHMCDGSTLGAAVIFSDTTTGNVDVDAKLNAAKAAKIASLAAAKGHSPVLARAMIIREAEAYAWKRGDEVTVSGSLPPDLPRTSLILNDSDKTVLSLTKDQTVLVGLARPLAGGIKNLGEALGLPGWRKASNYTENVMHRARLNKKKADAEYAAAVKRNVERTKAVIIYIQSNVDEAIANDPSNVTFFYDKFTGLLTPESQIKWKRQTDLAIASWRRVQSGIVQLRKLGKEAEKLGLRRIEHDLNLADLYTRAGREIARLRAERSKYRI